MGLYISLFFAIILIIAGPALLIISLRQMNTGSVRARLDEYVAEDSARSGRFLRNLTIQTRGLTGSIFNRVLFPWIRSVGKLLGRATPGGTIDNLNHKLLVAGNPYGLDAKEFYGIELALLFIGGWVSIIILSPGINNTRLLMAVAPLAFGYLLPRSWLSGRMRKRQDTVRRGLPDAMDLLSVCASAGLGFDQAMQRVSEHWTTPVGQEFARVIAEMEMGLSRQQALRNMSDRLDIAEVSSFVSFMIQTEQLGMSIVDTLISQAEQMRVERRFRAQEQAQKIPVKMLIPMAFLIFPALMAMVLGPAIPPLLGFFTNFGK